jgi:hypothetical protein
MLTVFVVKTGFVVASGIVASGALASSFFASAFVGALVFGVSDLGGSSASKHEIEHNKPNARSFFIFGGDNGGGTLCS